MIIRETAIVLLFITLLQLTGCPSPTGDTGNNDAQTGVFVDAIVEGAWYSTPSYSGRTNAKGEFTYKEGETVTFSIGSIELGSVKAKAIITPLTLGGDENLNNIGSKSKGIARILQSLDSDTAAANIVISDKLESLSVTSVDYESENGLTAIVNAAKAIDSAYTLKAESDALKAMKDFLSVYLYEGTYKGTYQKDPSAYTSCMDTGIVELTISKSSDPNKLLDVTGTAAAGEYVLPITGGTFDLSTFTGEVDQAGDIFVWEAVFNEDGEALNGRYYTEGYSYGTPGTCYGTAKIDKVD